MNIGIPLMKVLLLLLEVYIVIAHPSSDPSILAIADETHGYLSNGDDGYALAFGSEESHVILDMIGDFNGDPGSGWDVAGVSDATVDHTLVRKMSVTEGNSDWNLSAGTNSDDSQWIVFDIDTWDYLGTHQELVISGCTDSQALNHNPQATSDDGSCAYEISGCTNIDALNYNSAATVDDGSCDLTQAAPLFFSEYGEGSSNNKYLEIFNPTSDSVDLSYYAYPNVIK